MTLISDRLQSTNLHTMHQWTMQWIARELNIQPQNIASDVTFEEIGLSSIQIIAMAAAMEEEMQFEVDYDLAWAFPTVAQLIAYLALQYNLA